MCQSIYPHVLYLGALYIENDFEGDADVDVEFANLLNEAGWYVHNSNSSYTIASIPAS